MTAFEWHSVFMFGYTLIGRINSIQNIKNVYTCMSLSQSLIIDGEKSSIQGILQENVHVRPVNEAQWRSGDARGQGPKAQK